MAHTLIIPARIPYKNPVTLATNWLRINGKLIFSEKRSAWQNETAELPNITDSLLLIQKREDIRNLRLEMNYYGEKVLRNYDQDTVAIQVDSIIHWLQLVQTYPTELRLARHYFLKMILLLFSNSGSK